MKQLNELVDSLINKTRSFEAVTKEGSHHIDNPVKNSFKQWYQQRKAGIKITLIAAALSPVFSAPFSEAMITKQMIDNTGILNTEQDYTSAGLNLRDVLHDAANRVSHFYMNNDDLEIQKLKRITDVVYKYVDPTLSGKENYQILRDKDTIIADIASKNGISKDTVKNVFLPEAYNQSVKTLDDLQNIGHTESKIDKLEKMSVLMKATYNPFIPANIRYDSALQLKEMLNDKDIAMDKDNVSAQRMMLAQTLIKLSSDVKSSPEIKVKSRMELQKILNEEVANSNSTPVISKNNKY